MPRSLPLPALVASAFLVACGDSARPVSPDGGGGPSLAVATAHAARAAPSTAGLGVPLRGLATTEMLQFVRGSAVFGRTFVAATGLGPLFNADGCGECHEDPVPGGEGDEVEVHASLVAGDGTCDLMTAVGGMVVQQNATPALTAALGLTHEVVPFGAAIGRRATNDLFGLGMLDAVPDAVILARADPDDVNGDGISGRPNLTGDGRIGRFGRKAATATLREFNADAAENELGLTSPLVMSELSVGGAPLPAGVDPLREPELSRRDFDDLDAYVRFLAPPPALAPSGEAREGQALFAAIGCAACHVPTLGTGQSSSPALRQKSVSAFTDLLLHDMGPQLADVCVGRASPAEFRTEPLMGLRFNTHFLHDGRAATVESAILLHGGEADRTRRQFEHLRPAQRAALIAYLNTL